MITRALALGLMVAGTAAAQNKNVVLFDTHGYIPFVAEVAANPVVRKFCWSPNGRYLAARREWTTFNPNTLRPLPVETTIYIYDAQTSRGWNGFQTRDEKITVMNFGWHSNEFAHALVTVGSDTDVPKNRLVVIDGARGTHRTLMETESNITVVRAPNSNGATAWLTDDHRAFVLLDGGTRGQFAMPDRERMWMLFYSADGKRIYLEGVKLDEAKSIDARHYMVDLSAATLTPAPCPEPKDGDLFFDLQDEEELQERKDLQLKLEIGTNVASLTEGATARKSSLWIMRDDGKSPVLLSADVEYASFAPTGTRLAYTSNNALWMVNLIRASAEQLELLIGSAEQTRALSNARQVGMAILMYAADEDDILPPPGPDLQQKLGPYLKTDELLDGFVYTFGGGNIGKVANPSQTELGYISLGGGRRAVVYADGHASVVNK